MGTDSDRVKALEDEVAALRALLAMDDPEPNKGRRGLVQVAWRKRKTARDAYLSGKEVV